MIDTREKFEGGGRGAAYITVQKSSTANFDVNLIVERNDVDECIKLLQNSSMIRVNVHSRANLIDSK